MRIIHPNDAANIRAPKDDTSGVYTQLTRLAADTHANFSSNPDRITLEINSHKPSAQTKALFHGQPEKTAKI
jgi:hypothetical protein